MNARGLASHVLPSLIAGTSRRPIDMQRAFGSTVPPGDPKAPLAALALAGQALRLARPPVPDFYAADAVRPPARRPVPERLRPALVRLVGDGKGALAPSDDLAVAVAAVLSRRRLQPHPFDFPRLEAFLGAHAEILGPDALAWTSRDKGAGAARGFFDAEAIDDGNWHEAPPSLRRRHVEDRRRSDPDAGRALVEAVFAGEAAEMRLKLLEALRTGLGPSDESFLTGLSSDRAPRVRELAERLLSRLPGGKGGNRALADLLGRIERGQAGFFRKRPTLKLTPPATVAGEGWRMWIAEASADVETEELAAALALAPDALAAAAEGDAPLTALLALLAFREGDPSRAGKALECLAEPHPVLDMRMLEAVAEAPPAAQCGLAETLVAHALAGGRVTQELLAASHRLVGGPFSERLARAVLDQAPWREWAAVEFRAAAALSALAAVVPPAVRPALRAALAPLDPALTGRIAACLDLLDSLEEVPPHE